MHEEKYIDINGTPQLLSENEICSSKKEALAYIIGDMYFVLTSSDGDLFNPQDSSMSRGKRDHEKGGYFFQLRKCNKVCYDYYVTFLKTKNKTHYILAQRNFK